jgi:hypothetical protein
MISRNFKDNYLLLTLYDKSKPSLVRYKTFPQEFCFDKCYQFYII